MDDDAPKPHDADRYRIGEELYSLSVHEFEARISAYESEIIRLRDALERKRRERNAADALFGKR
ncbi:DUF1192 domain-containing protein [uncultured Algimonas sp.]|uniref:DUF1192 domain-containing protein n=1 Tax=uncultured Algimonas sp. TaxID=1547920 RepID=UPI0026371889|nr:DUF1192 domain-containing protein [uncultured Algimonas sp.]